MVNIIKQELENEESLKKKIEFICEFTNNKPNLQNGSIRKIDKTNLIYIEPHRITIKNIDFLHSKIHNWINHDNKYIDVVNDRYQDNILMMKVLMI